MSRDTPTADDVARAIVAAARETGGDVAEVAIAVASGQIDKRRGRHAGAAGAPYPIFRARAYAAKALAMVFTTCWRTRIAGYVGVRGLSRQSYFSSLDQRLASPAGEPWWNKTALARVVADVESARHEAAAADRQIDTADAPEPQEEFFKTAVHKAPSPRAALRTIVESGVQRPPVPYRAQPYKHGPLPEHRPEKMGAFEPPEIEDGLMRRASERTRLQDMLAEAARNTAALTTPKARDDDD